jgi:hypothetical protein
MWRRWTWRWFSCRRVDFGVRRAEELEGRANVGLAACLCAGDRIREEVGKQRGERKWWKFQYLEDDLGP